MRIHALTPRPSRIPTGMGDGYKLPSFVTGEEGEAPMSKRTKALAAKKQEQDKMNNYFQLKKIQPLTKNQSKTFDAFNQGYSLLLHGYPGTGKTFISLALALKEVLQGNSPYQKIIIIRSVVPSRDIGYLPGSYIEKIKVYEEPYREICDTLFGKNDGYDALKASDIIEFTTTSFLRGVTFENCIVIVDEIQNMVFQEIDTIMTRLGNNSKIIFCGDFRQTDLQKETEKSGLIAFMKILNDMDTIFHVEFEIEDIVRSGIVKSYIIAKMKAGVTNL